jgi:hypothetical protein
MPFVLVPKEREPELRAKKDNFKIRRAFAPGIEVTFSPDNWTRGIAVVVADTKTGEVVAYWHSSKVGGCWVFVGDELYHECPYLFKRPKAAFSRMTKAGDVVNLNPRGKKLEARLAVWHVEDVSAIEKYEQISGSEFPGSPRR